MSDKTVMDHNAPKNKQKGSGNKGTHKEADAQEKKRGNGKFGAGIAVGVGASGVAAGTVAAAGVAGYAVGASQPFQEFAKEVIDDMGFNSPHEAAPSAALPVDLEEQESVDHPVVEEIVAEDWVVETEEEGEPEMLLHDAEGVEIEELVAEEEYPMEEAIVEEPLPYEEEEVIAEPSCEPMDDVEMEPNEALEVDSNTDPLADNFIDPNIPIDNDMDMSEFI